MVISLHAYAASRGLILYLKQSKIKLIVGPLHLFLKSTISIYRFMMINLHPRPSHGLNLY